MKKYAIIVITVIQKCLGELKKILKYNPGEKSLKAPFAIYLDLDCILKNFNLFKTTQNNLIQKKKLDMSLLVGRYIQNVHMIKKKIGLITIEEKIVLKNYVKS